MFQLAWRETDFKKALWRKTHFGRRMAGTKVQKASGRKLVSKYSWRETEDRDSGKTMEDGQTEGR